MSVCPGVQLLTVLQGADLLQRIVEQGVLQELAESADQGEQTNFSCASRGRVTPPG